MLREWFHFKTLAMTHILKLECKFVSLVPPFGIKSFYIPVPFQNLCRTTQIGQEKVWPFKNRSPVVGQLHKKRICSRDERPKEETVDPGEEDKRRTDELHSHEIWKHLRERLHGMVCFRRFRIRETINVYHYLLCNMCTIVLTPFFSILF